MNRMPNPWIVIPVAVAAIAGSIVGYLVTNASCAPETCTATAILVGTAVGIGAGVGVGIVVVLALKSLSEWTEHVDREILTASDPDEPRTPPTC